MTRKKPFGNASKKKQLQEKREKKRAKNTGEWDWNEPEYRPTAATTTTIIKKDPNDTTTTSSSSANVGSSSSGSNMISSVTDKKSKLRTFFEKESQDLIDERIRQSRLPLKRTSPSEDNKESLTGEIEYTSLDMPVRPEWNRDMDSTMLEKREEIYFSKYLENIYKKYSRLHLNHFEHNLNVWRQLWRVIELSDICLLVADIRHPLFHFPQSLYRYVTEYHKKPLVFVLNKCDLVGEEQTQKWIKYFSEHYPLLKVVAFSTYTSAVHDEKEKKTRRRKKQVDYHLVHKIWSACKDIEIPGKPNVPQYWKELIDRANEKLKEATGSGVYESESDEEDEDEQQSELVTKKNEKEQLERLKKTSENVITLGLIGHPNTGKSCLLNGLVGKTVVSASYTPGHTKHFQTYFVGKHIRLCDSPGLVFPATDMPKSLQVLCGIFPIAQVREPYSAIQYLAERVALEKIYKLQLPKDEGFEEWSAWGICVAYALKRGYVTTRMARPDVYRAANEILRETLYGFPVLLAFDPPAGRLPERKVETNEIDLLEIEQQHQRLDMEEAMSADYYKDSDNEETYEIDSDGEEDDEETNEDEEDDEEIASTGNQNPFSVLADDE